MSPVIPVVVRPMKFVVVLLRLTAARLPMLPIRNLALFPPAGGGGSAPPPSSAILFTGGIQPCRSAIEPLLLTAKKVTELD